MPTCTFSGEKIPTGKGLQYVQKDGKVLWFKNSKSMKNYLNVKRNPRKVRWTKTYRDANMKGSSSAAKKESAVPVKKALVKDAAPQTSEE